MVQGVAWRVKEIGNRVQGVGDLGPERANAILEYLYHHNVCNSVRCASCKTATPLGHMSEVPL